MTCRRIYLLTIKAEVNKSYGASMAAETSRKDTKTLHFDVTLDYLLSSTYQQISWGIFEEQHLMAATLFKCLI